MITFNPDKFGYYQVGDRKTYRKLEALEWSNQTNIAPRWNFNDEIFSQYDWTIEPNINLWDLYKERARQIRNAYDYCVIFYSGGSDSHNLLNAWIEADCKIDEIATTWNYKTTGELYNHQNAEITHVVLPDIKALQNKGYDFKFRLIELPEISLKLFDDWKLDFEYNINLTPSVNSSGKHLIRKYIDDYKKIIYSGKKLCFIWGMEKPCIENNNENLYYYFYDRDDCLGTTVQNNYFNGWYDEYFYWSPDCPLIPIKQSHIIKKFISQVNIESFYVNYYNSHGYNSKIKMYLSDNTMKTLLYPKWSNSIYCNGKTATGYIFSERDKWFHKRKDILVQRYVEAIKSFKTIAGNKYNITDKLIPFHSKKYLI
jgi:hypothetical protein